METRSLLDELNDRSADAEQMSFEQLLVEGDAPSPPADQPAKVHDVTAPVSGRHQDVRLYLTVLLKTFVEMTDTGLVRDTPFEVHLNNDLIYRPDIVYIANASFDRVHDQYIEGPPDIAIEVLSRDTTAVDRGDKFVAFEASGVREYWLIDPVRELADLYHLGPDGLYDEFRPDIAGRLRSRILRGFTLDLDLLWRRVLPTTSEIVEMAHAMVSQR